jgi:hypothetical protein
MVIDGTYQIQLDTPVGKQDIKAVLKTEGNKLIGSSDSLLGKLDFTGVVKGDTFSWDMVISGSVGSMKLEFTGKLSGDEISGAVKAGEWGKFPYRGKKI